MVKLPGIDGTLVIPSSPVLLNEAWGTSAPPLIWRLMGKLLRLWAYKRKRKVMGFVISAEINKCQPCTNCGAFILGKKFDIQVQVGSELKTITGLCKVCQNAMSNESK